MYNTCLKCAASVLENLKLDWTDIKQGTWLKNLPAMQTKLAQISLTIADFGQASK